MKKSKGYIWLGLLLAILVLGSSWSQADIYMKQKQHTDGFEIMGQKQAAQDLINEIWMTKTAVRSDNQLNSTILLLDKGILYVIDHQKKTYMEIPINFREAVAKTAAKDKEEAEEMKKMMASMMKMDIKITATGEAKTIRTWKCKKYYQTIETFMGPMKSEIWASQDIKIDYDVYNKFATAMFAKMPGMGDAMQKMLAEMKKIKGVPVLTLSKNTMMGQTINSSTELLEYKTGKAPAGIFQVPKGYKKNKKPMGPMQ
jgi:hypothetical protein